ncbi:MAG: hypothetical protein COV72_04225 [Candidatus Omnitrophica bacterium CG11_big_fil_rev_8_21_14_0_20_42_13]|uniref:Transposase IS200-like domain-containing protein n=1 Tax=Candidatus Ghiorseimicrobium undicola TaxID=1974746 RepID=A0A2H0LZY7_9BACT|nr:MAG: hypothetical protein COV72_04225 [Candidatus Omnitrophica bacterium CG11_big_fil_rev_8_21_14_0_20_42_13]
MRKHPLITGEIYHIFNKSIAGFTIFNNNDEYQRILVAMKYYTVNKHSSCLSRFLEIKNKPQANIQIEIDNYLATKTKIIDIIAYCIMPTHIHLILKQLKENGISEYVNNLCNSYTRFFNTKHKRKGPLWESRFKSRLVRDDNQLLHLTRYLHLNPTTAFIVDRPESWQYSSYQEYTQIEKTTKFCNFRDLIDMPTEEYKKFNDDRISYQRELAQIKDLIMDEPSVDLRGLHG